MDDGGGLCVEDDGERRVELVGVFRCEGACAGERWACSCRKGPPAWCVARRRFGDLNFIG